ncbi:MAG: TIGR03118 family protein [Pseudomonadota bacterium]|nr:TIGR03118 family protein [Pseudomonadota bacterium]
MSTLRSFANRLPACVGAALIAACGGGSGSGMGTGMDTGMHFVATTLVSDIATSTSPYASANVDPHLANGFGIAFNPRGFVWVADEATSVSTLYDGNGSTQPLVVTIPPGSVGAARPTGIVFNATQDFQVSLAGVTGASAFVFAGQAGTLAGWSPAVNMTNAVTVVDDGAQGAVFKGLAIASQGTANVLYATDFHHGVVDVFDRTFTPVVVPGAFSDAALPAGYAPFGIQAIGGLVYVTFAKQDAALADQVSGAGLGAVDVFDASGTLVKRLIAAGGALNAPWGMAMAPANFGPFSNDLLVANFGDGKINAFDPATGALVGTLTRPDGTPIAIDGLWGIAFGNGINAQPTQTLFYAAGPASQTLGVYGRIDIR